MQTTYHRMESTAPPDALMERRVAYQMDPEFYTVAPDCTVIRTRSAAPQPLLKMVEQTVERHLATRLKRVIGGAQRRRIERSLGIDMEMATDRRTFVRQARCRTSVEISLEEISDDYMVLWARRGIAMKLTMKRLADDQVLWAAHHRASRSDGGLPLSVLSLPFSAARAARLKSDPEMFASITDDAVRRMMKTLPDTRQPSLAGTSLGQ
jgi:hypothetical protein